MAVDYKRQLLFRTNKFQRPIIKLVVSAALVTVVVISFCVAYIFYGMVGEVMHPTTEVPIAKLVVLLVLMVIPLLFFATIVWTYKITNELVGAFERLLRELDDIIATNQKKHLKVRENDNLAAEVVTRINSLIDKIP